MADLGPMRVMLPNRSAAAETRLPRDEGNEATWHRANDGRPFRGSHEDVEPLSTWAADGDDEPASRHELVIERGRRLERGGCDGDRTERRVFRNAASPVADVDVHAALVAGRNEIRVRFLSEL